MGEEERNRKIINDTNVAIVANRAIIAILDGSLSDEQVRELHRIDARYLRDVAHCVGNCFEVPASKE